MNTFKTSRELAADPAAVFAVIKDPARLARWWGPNGFSNRFETFEFVPGGQWVFSMIGPDGTTYANASTFTRIDEDRRVVIEHISPPQFVLTIALEPSAGGTMVTWEQVFADAAVANAVRPIVEPANEQNLDRLNVEIGQK
ncbi:SRPBCC domain-containing protein [Silvimonas sp.]|uniref:SRPBCC domain-containing protein n=1 Tax=Silvimonas sp. TaxID=2650811 RepID=UPI00284BA5D2|nr:SRPBCC domain-containing protein [Silvimonas sp.]MDR3427702.1 SRPBCC domain-containing protein [Silvimonas sp.]